MITNNLGGLKVGDLVRTAETGDEWLPVTKVYDPSCARPGGVHITERKPSDADPSR